LVIAIVYLENKTLLYYIRKFIYAKRGLNNNEE
jgi:hypothetical protein